MTGFKVLNIRMASDYGDQAGQTHTLTPCNINLLYIVLIQIEYSNDQSFLCDCEVKSSTFNEGEPFSRHCNPSSSIKEQLTISKTSSFGSKAMERIESLVI